MADLDRLYDRANAIRERHANGHAIPILEALSLRGHEAARTDLAGLFTDPDEANICEQRRGMKIMLTDAMRGDETALYNLAIHFRNRNDLHRYRYWLT